MNSMFVVVVMLVVVTLIGNQPGHLGCVVGDCSGVGR